MPLFYRYLGPEMYALWFYVLTFSGLFVFADLGLGSAVGRYMGVALDKVPGWPREPPYTTRLTAYFQHVSSSPA